MSNKISMSKLSNDISRRLDGMTVRSQAGLQAYLARNVYKQYQKAQMKRWQTQGSSGTGQWAELSEAYAATKRVKFASYPGHGVTLLVATNRLQKSVIGTSGEHRLMVAERSIRIATVVPYAEYVNDARQFEKLGEKTTREILNGIKRFLAKGAAA